MATFEKVTPVTEDEADDIRVTLSWMKAKWNVKFSQFLKQTIAITLL